MWKRTEVDAQFVAQAKKRGEGEVGQAIVAHEIVLLLEPVFELRKESVELVGIPGHAGRVLFGFGFPAGVQQTNDRRHELAVAQFDEQPHFSLGGRCRRGECRRGVFVFQILVTDGRLVDPGPFFGQHRHFPIRVNGKKPRFFLFLARQVYQNAIKVERLFFENNPCSHGERSRQIVEQLSLDGHAWLLFVCANLLTYRP